MRGETSTLHGSISRRVQAQFRQWQQLHKAGNFAAVLQRVWARHFERDGDGQDEPCRVCRRLQLLRRWSDAAGDDDGRRAWMRILAAIDELKRVKRLPSEGLH